MQSKIRAGDTIAAIATPPGEGAISIVRLSGPQAITFCEKIFRGSTSLLSAAGNTIHHGYIVEPDGKEIDEVLVSVFVSPHSYTGENLIEIGCHGGMATSSRVLTALLRGGSRQADPGEFTKRAFLNGKMDLSQAEAVADLISARSSRAQEVSMAQLRGALSERVNRVKDGLIETCSLLEIDLDFSEEGISIIPTTEVRQRLAGSMASIKSLLSTFETGKIVRNGVRVAIVGPPNAGKSSIFNRLLQQDRAIVSDIPGTTRDYLEEAIAIDGILFQLVDTAGLRETEDHVERQGVARAQQILRAGDIGIAVVDVTEPPERTFFETLLPFSGKLVLALNKVDLLGEKKDDPGYLSEIAFNARVPVSARTGDGMLNLRSALLSCMGSFTHLEETGVAVTSQRQADALGRALVSVELSMESLDKGLTNEFVALDARGAVSAISEITGEITTEDILNSVFSRFCVGK